MSPARRRAAVAHLVRKFPVSERRACRVVGQHRSSQRYEPVPGDFEVKLVAAMRRDRQTQGNKLFRGVGREVV